MEISEFKFEEVSLLADGTYGVGGYIIGMDLSKPNTGDKTVLSVFKVRPENPETMELVDCRDLTQERNILDAVEFKSQIERIFEYYKNLPNETNNLK